MTLPHLEVTHLLDNTAMWNLRGSRAAARVGPRRRSSRFMLAERLNSLKACTWHDALRFVSSLFLSFGCFLWFVFLCRPAQKTTMTPGCAVIFAEPPPPSPTPNKKKEGRAMIFAKQGVPWTAVLIPQELTKFSLRSMHRHLWSFPTGSCGVLFLSRLANFWSPIMFRRRLITKLQADVFSLAPLDQEKPATGSTLVRHPPR